MIISYLSNYSNIVLVIIVKEYSILEIQDMMDKGQLTSTQLVEMYLQRIQEIDKNGPKLNSVIELNPDVLEIAKSLDEERAQNGKRGMLHGIPVMLKDNINI